MDIYEGETRTPQFLAKNPNGRIPTLELDDGTFLAESNAILWYLAENTPFVPRGPAGARAGVCSGCSSSNTATSRTWRRRAPSCVISRPSSPRHAELPERRAKGAGACGDGRASGPPQLLRQRALLDRGHRAVRLHARRAGWRHRAGCLPDMLAWIGRVASQPRHIRLTDTPMG